MVTFYNLVTISFYTNGDYSLILGQYTNTHFCLTYYGGIFIGNYIENLVPSP